MTWQEALRDINRKFDALRRVTVRYRQGEVTAVSPLSVALGGSDVSYTNVKTLRGASMSVGNIVACLTFGNDVLVLGKVTTTVSNSVVYGPFTTSTSAAIAASNEQSVSFSHNLGLTAQQITDAVIVGHVEDGFFSSLASWRVSTITTNSVTVLFGNGSSRTDVTAKLKFRVITTPT